MKAFLSSTITHLPILPSLSASAQSRHPWASTSTVLFLANMLVSHHRENRGTTHV